MTPQEKAREILDRFYQTTPNEAWYNPPLGSLSMEYKAWEQAKECALIAVNEVKNTIDWFGYCNTMYDHPVLGKCRITEEDDPNDYWQEVKQEIEKL